MNHVFILLLFISTTYSFILPSRILGVKTVLNEKYGKKENEKDSIWTNNVEKVNNVIINLLKKRYNIETDDIYEIDDILSKKCIDFENNFNEKTNNFFKPNANYNSNFTNLIHNHIDFVHSFNDNIINYINSFDVKLFNEKIKKMMTIPTGEKLRNNIIKSQNDNGCFIQLHYMLFKNQIFETLSPVEQDLVRSFNEKNVSHPKGCECPECVSHPKDCECDDCNVSECECHDCDVSEYECPECKSDVEVKPKGEECNAIDKMNDYDNNFIDTIGLVPIGIFPNFIIKMLVKRLLIPF